MATQAESHDEVRDRGLHEVSFSHRVRVGENRAVERTIFCCIAESGTTNEAADGSCVVAKWL